MRIGAVICFKNRQVIYDQRYYMAIYKLNLQLKFSCFQIEIRFHKLFSANRLPRKCQFGHRKIAINI